ncbi:hypothetical protein AAHC03_017024 [Spirometra sp. Aus1]
MPSSHFRPDQVADSGKSASPPRTGTNTEKSDNPLAPFRISYLKKRSRPALLQVGVLPSKVKHLETETKTGLFKPTKEDEAEVNAELSNDPLNVVQAKLHPALTTLTESIRSHLTAVATSHMLPEASSTDLTSVLRDVNAINNLSALTTVNQINAFMENFAKSEATVYLAGDNHSAADPSGKRRHSSSPSASPKRSRDALDTTQTVGENPDLEKISETLKSMGPAIDQSSNFSSLQYMNPQKMRSAQMISTPLIANPALANQSKQTSGSRTLDDKSVSRRRSRSHSKSRSRHCSRSTSKHRPHSTSHRTSGDRSRQQHHSNHSDSSHSSREVRHPEQKRKDTNCAQSSRQKDSQGSEVTPEKAKSKIPHSQPKHDQESKHPREQKPSRPASSRESAKVQSKNSVKMSIQQKETIISSGQPEKSKKSADPSSPRGDNDSQKKSERNGSKGVSDSQSKVKTEKQPEPKRRSTHEDAKTLSKKSGVDSHRSTTKLSSDRQSHSGCKSGALSVGEKKVSEKKQQEKGGGHSGREKKDNTAKKDELSSTTKREKSEISRTVKPESASKSRSQSLSETPDSSSKSRKCDERLPLKVNTEPP